MSLYMELSRLLVQSFEAVLKGICINILTHHRHYRNFYHCHPTAGFANQVRQKLINEGSHSNSPTSHWKISSTQYV